MSKPKEPLKLIPLDDLKRVLAKIVAAPKPEERTKKGPRRSEARD